MRGLLLCSFLLSCEPSPSPRNAVVTLVTGKASGYVSGALALGQSLVNVGSRLPRVVMVTPEVETSSRSQLAHLYEVIEVAPITCNHRIDASVDPKQYDLEGERYKKGVEVCLQLPCSSWRNIE